MSKEVDESKGRWRTICGRRVFIENGQSVSEAMRASGKFSKEVIDAVDENENDKDEQDKKKEIGTMTKEELAKFLGPEYKNLKGQAAVEKIISEKCGHVKGAFTRQDIGDIDLFWGDDRKGLRHILERRAEQGLDPIDFVSDLTDVVGNGVFGGAAKAPDSFILRTKDKSVVISYTYAGNDIQYVISDFPSKGGGKGKKKPPQ